MSWYFVAYITSVGRRHLSAPSPTLSVPVST